MCVVELFASPHSEGNTAGMLKEYVKDADNIKFYDLYAISPQPCIDCGECAKEENCVFHDLDELMSDFETADRVIFAFPVYNMSFPAPMKALFDRFQRYYNARFSLNKKPPIEKRREAVLLITCGREFGQTQPLLMQQIKQAFSVLNLEITDIKIKENTDKDK